MLFFPFLHIIINQTQEGIYQHFKAIAEASPIPVVLYNATRKERQATCYHQRFFVWQMTSLILLESKKQIGDLVQAMKIIQHKPKISWLFRATT